jgi:hypothetical protein
MLAFQPEILRLSCQLFKKAPTSGQPEHPEESMDIFKGLLFLHGHLTAIDAGEYADTPALARRQYGAHTAAADLAAPLGNGGLSRQWSGADNPGARRLPELGCVAGGCG